MSEDVPIALMIFNRPDLTQLIMFQLAKAKPPILYVIADGARNEEELTKCTRAREIALNPTWSCKVVPFLRDHNVGMVKQFKEGLDFVFNEHESLIFMEDDHFLSSSFYQFSCELLERHQENSEIVHINLTNYHPKLTLELKSDYFLSSHFSVWGFATWKRVWKTYNISMPEWKNHSKKDFFKNYFSNKRIAKGYIKMFDLHCDNVDPWTYDYQWLFNCMQLNGYALTPKYNLCSNIGFEREDATHNKGKNPFSHPIEDLNYPLQHPHKLQRDELFDEHISSLMCPSIFQRALNRITQKLKL